MEKMIQLFYEDSKKLIEETKVSTQSTCKVRLLLAYMYEIIGYFLLSLVLSVPIYFHTGLRIRYFIFGCLNVVFCSLGKLMNIPYFN